MMKEILEGKKILGFEILEYGFCSMPLSDGYAISAETLCRFIGQNGDFISTQDHGQKSVTKGIKSLILTGRFYL